MARQVQILLTDDLEAGEVQADETISFSLDGTTYEIDLSDRNAQAMRDAFGRYVGAARRVKGGPVRKASAGRRPTDREESHAIRAWARKNGWPDLADRGRIPAEVVERYQARTRAEQPPIPNSDATPRQQDATPKQQPAAEKPAPTATNPFHSPLVEAAQRERAAREQRFGPAGAKQPASGTEPGKGQPKG